MTRLLLINDTITTRFEAESMAADHYLANEVWLKARAINRLRRQAEARQRATQTTRIIRRLTAG